MKSIFTLSILLTFWIQSSAQNFEIDSCYHYFKEYKDEKLYAYLTKFENSNNLEDKIGIHLYFSRYYREAGNKNGQLKHLTLGHDLVKNRLDSNLCNYLDELAILFRSDESSSKAEGLNYINQSIATKKFLKVDSNSIARSYIIKGNLFLAAYKNEGFLDSARVNYSISKKYALTDDLPIAALYNLASIAQKNNELSEAELAYEEIIEHYKSKKTLKEVVSAKINLAYIYATSKDSILYRKITKEISSVLSKTNWIDEKTDLLKLEIYNGFQINKSYEQIMEWQDSMLLLEKQQTSTLLDQITKFELNNKVAAAEAKLYKNRFWQSILLGTTLTMILVLIGLYKYLVLKRKTIEDELEHTKTVAVLEATKAKMEGEQKERESIAAVLHDQVASLLTAADIHLKVAHKKAPDSQGLTKVSSIIKDINQQVRDLSHQLVSPTLMKFGLEAGLETLTHRMQTQQLHLHFESNLGEARYETSLETFIFQSCAELIQNVLKHSSATVCKVTLSLQENELKLTVTDNGDNSNIDHNQPTGLGLTHIYKRAQAMGGSFDFQLKNNGACSILKVPAQKTIATPRP